MKNYDRVNVLLLELPTLNPKKPDKVLGFRLVQDSQLGMGRLRSYDLCLARFRPGHREAARKVQASPYAYATFKLHHATLTHDEI